MKILAVDSSARAASAAIVEDGRIIAESYSDSGLTHSCTLMPMIDGLFKSSMCHIKDIDLFAVSHGPGSFTGVRIGVSAVKGMADALGKGCLGVSTLEAIAYGLYGIDCTAVSVMDARCNQVYTALFRCEKGRVERLTPDEAIPIDELKERLSNIEGEKYLIGDGAELCFDRMKLEGLKLAPQNIRLQHAGCVGLCAQAKLKTDSPVEPSELVPVYLRLPQAERELRKKQAEKQ